MATDGKEKKKPGCLAQIGSVLFLCFVLLAVYSCHEARKQETENRKQPKEGVGAHQIASKTADRYKESRKAENSLEGDSEAPESVPDSAEDSEESAPAIVAETKFQKAYIKRLLILYRQLAELTSNPDFGEKSTSAEYQDWENHAKSLNRDVNKYADRLNQQIIQAAVDLSALGSLLFACPDGNDQTDVLRSNLRTALGDDHEITYNRTVHSSPEYAYKHAKEFVRTQLNAPSAAVFPPPEDVSFESLGDNTYRFASFVDSPNAFGVPIRSRYVITIKRERSGDWVVYEFDLL